MPSSKDLVQKKTSKMNRLIDIILLHVMALDRKLHLGRNLFPTGPSTASLVPSTQKTYDFSRRLKGEKKDKTPHEKSSSTKRLILSGRK